jgi:putative transcriptional regulator
MIMKRKTKRSTTQNDKNQVLDSIRESIEDLKSVQDVTETLREFDKLRYREPRHYSRTDIIRLRKKKMRMSQSVFAAVCNAKLSTVQKWERGVAKPTPPVYRLFQLIENDALDLIER